MSEQKQPTSLQILIARIFTRLGFYSSVFAIMCFDYSGKVYTAKNRTDNVIPQKGDELLPVSIEGGIPTYEVSTEYREIRNSHLLSFQEKSKLDCIVIVGCAYGRELVPLVTKLSDLNKSVTVIGADLSTKAIEACKKYNLKNAEFYVLDIENENSLDKFYNSTLIKFSRVGFYMCETGCYILPKKMEQFFEIISGYSNVVATQILEPACIDWSSKYESGMIFSYQKNFWRHNYYRIISRFFEIERIFFIDPIYRTSIHLDQPLWFISAKK